jgi:hypothetical protein
LVPMGVACHINHVFTLSSLAKPHKYLHCLAYSFSNRANVPSLIDKYYTGIVFESYFFMDMKAQGGIDQPSCFSYCSLGTKRNGSRAICPASWSKLIVIERQQPFFSFARYTVCSIKKPSGPHALLWWRYSRRITFPQSGV